ncbi:MAG: YeeE/YedE family protein [Halanaerobium sp.]
MEINISKKQLWAALILIFIMIIAGNQLAVIDQGLTLSLITGLFFGYILTRGRFGFAGGVKKIYITGEGSLTKALLVMFGVTIIAMAGLHWGAAADGAVVSYLAEGDLMQIPGSASVKVLNLATLIGGFTFGMGMMLAGGCASGTLTDLGEGAFRSAIALLFFAIGSVPGVSLRYAFDQSNLANFSTKMYLPHHFGYVGATVISLVLLLGMYMMTRKYESIRRKENHFEEMEYTKEDLPLEETEADGFFSFKTYHKFFMERWSFMRVGLLLAVMFVFVINTTGKSWGVTSAYARWGVVLFDNLGFDMTGPAFQSHYAAVQQGLINDGGTIRNIGIIFGSSIAFLLASKFKFDFNFNLKDAGYYALGGALMGFGARMAKGCNIGALYSAIANFSLHGWAFLVALTLGGIFALKIFAGKVNIIPASRYEESEEKIKEELSA